MKLEKVGAALPKIFLELSDIEEKIGESEILHSVAVGRHRGTLEVMDHTCQWKHEGD